MSLFDGYADPDQFRDSGGLLGRLLSLRPDLADQMQGQARVDRPAFVPRAPALTPMFWSNSAASYNAQSGGLASSSLQSQPGLNSSDLGQSWLAQALANTQRLFDVPTAIPSLTAFQPMAFQVATAAPPPIVPTPAPDTSQNVAVSVNPETPALANASGSQPPLPPSQLLSNNQHATSAASGLLADFYRQTILQAGKDIAGYFNDAVNDPAAFVHAIGPSLVGLGPAVTELPSIVRGAMGVVGILQPVVKHNYGDLTVDEIQQIQSVVNEAGRPLEVVGSAARGARKAKSDIDYVIPPASMPYYKGLQEKLPGVDPAHGIIPGAGNLNIGPVIRFEPK